MIRTFVLVSKVVLEVRCNHSHVVFHTRIDKDIDLNLRFVSKKSIFSLHSDRTDLARDNQVVQAAHAFALIDTLCPTDSFILVNKHDFVGTPAERVDITRKINLLHISRDIADLFH